MSVAELGPQSATPDDFIGCDVLPAGRRWALIAAGSRDAAAEAVLRLGVDPVLVCGKAEIRSGSLRRAARAAAVDAAILYTEMWQRERAPQLLEVGLLMTGARVLYRLDARGGITRLIRPRVAERLVRVPVDAGSISVELAVDIARLRRPPCREAPPRPALGRQPTVLAIWIAYGAKRVGGAVTHAAGILNGLRERGVRIGLLAWDPLPDQLAGVADEFEPLAPLPARHRLTGDTEAVFMNRVVRAGAARLACRLPPSFVYQRHEAFLVAGAHVASDLAVPLALEWNCSVAWTRTHWDAPGRLGRSLNGVLADLERQVLRSSGTHPIAVSEHAARMAADVGASADRIAVVPNGVDFWAVRRAVQNLCPPLSQHSDHTELGWIGSFGPWHGAETMIRAVALLPATMRLVMIGEGRLRQRCIELANDLDVQDRIEWTGAMTHDDAIRRLAGCDVLVSPHLQLEDTPFFGSPTKLFEYLAIGRPIVASSLEQLAEVLRDGDNAVLAPPGDHVALAAAIRRVRALPDRGAALAQNAMRDARDLHDWKLRADAILDHLGITTTHRITGPVG